MGWRRQAWLVLMAALLVRFGYVCISGQLDNKPPPYSEQVRIARYLVHGTGFVSPVGPERSDPSSWYTPGYIGVLAAIYGLLGEDTLASLATIRIINLLAQAGAIAIWVIIARRLLGRRTAALAAVLMILSPLITFKAPEIWDTFPTMLSGALCLAAFVLLRPHRNWHYILVGALCGAGAMVNPCFTLCYPVWFIWQFRRSRHASRSSRGPWRNRSFPIQTLSLLLGFLVLIAPWTLRNRIVFGEWFYLRGNLGLEMWVANAPWSDGYFFSQDGRRIHPVFDPEQADRLIQRGEWGYFQDCMRDVKSWSRESPERFVKLGLRRVRWFWFGRFDLPTSRAAKILRFISYTLPGVLALAGALVCLIRRPSCWVLPATMFVFPCVYYLSVLMVRYRLPIEPLMLTMTAFFLNEMYRTYRRSRRTSTTRF